MRPAPQGLTEWQILTCLEIPLAANMMLAGSACTRAGHCNRDYRRLPERRNPRQVPLRRLAMRDYPRMLVATLLVALLAFAVDALMGLVRCALTLAELTINRKKA